MGDASNSLAQLSEAAVVENQWVTTAEDDFANLIVGFDFCHRRFPVLQPAWFLCIGVLAAKAVAAVNCAGGPLVVASRTRLAPVAGSGRMLVAKKVLIVPSDSVLPKLVELTLFSAIELSLPVIE